MNPDNIQRVIDQLLIEPDSRVEMENFWSLRKDNLIVCDYHTFEKFSKNPSCETAACLAGWVVHLGTVPVMTQSVPFRKFLTFQ